jgi:hypothetical protein
MQLSCQSFPNQFWDKRITGLIRWITGKKHDEWLTVRGAALVSGNNDEHLTRLIKHL